MGAGLKPDFAPLPRHLAIIMDGNGRWASGRGLQRLKGHEAGAEAVRDIVKACAEWGIPHLTLYAFSQENWSRPRSEVDGLMQFLRRFLDEREGELVEKGIHLKGLGRLQDLPPATQAALARVARATAGGKNLTLRLALSYGGRQEILDAVNALLRAGQTAPVTEAALRAQLHDPDMPDPDLIIRTAGEMRLSNFLLWQASYAELWFTEVPWPEFRRANLLEALRDYHSRVRRFGGVPAVETHPA